MIIKRLSATFGCLNGAQLELHPGLNVIESPNESGKSTWCAFIRAMLYGIDSSERAKTGFMPDKTRYAPWSGAPMAGTMELEQAGRDITLRRRTKTASAPMREFSAVYTGTEDPVPGLTGADCGELLTGVSREVFRRSAFIGQGALVVNGSAELERRIASVVASGEEDTSYTEAENRLRKWQNKRRYNRRGAIPELEAAIAGQEDLLGQLSGMDDNKQALSGQLERCTEECARLEAAIADARIRSRSDSSRRLTDTGSRIRALEEARDAAAEEAARKKAEVDSGPFATATAEEAARAAGEDAERAEALGRIAGMNASRLPPLFLFLLAAIALAGGIFLAWPLYIAAGVCAVAAYILFSRASAIRKNAAAAGVERNAILKKYAAGSVSAIYDAADLHAARREEYGAACREAERAAQDLDAARAAQAREQTRLVSGEEDAEVSALMRQLADAQAKKAAVSAKLSEMSGALRTVGDPMAIQSGILEMRARQEELETQYEALSLAAETLREADAEIQSRFSPALGRKAAQYMSRMTGGRYTELSLSRDFSASARLEGDAVSRDAAYLSAGAADLLYLAVRLAVCELALPEEDPCPIVLDDALVNLDAERSRAAMDLLTEMSARRQIILFKCR